MKARATSAVVAILLAAIPVAAAAQTTHVVNQTGTSFSPANLTIQVGDTVRWVWSSLAHTVTSGNGASDPNVGALFDAPLNSFSPEFQFQFTESGTVPYFCRPHELAGMAGTITVEEVGTPAPAASPRALRVHGVEPNPFNPRTSVVFTLGESSPVSVTVHDARGRLIRDLLGGVVMDAGEREVLWDGTGDDGGPVASGVYFFRVQARTDQEVVRGVLVR